ncbi:hypothetical protein Nocox_09685 [Nonomuraea coxensis DSM 45129]|uniref:Uncharacterized protein n=1 Tax=Nonomuraea coxensis DSM 45129 TaxID=1122611 RepID=A0ABX8TVW7_9ACTN|nr:hypothetical protein Nocox_09685 [Nonomuraea coxensis DSM 45129]
MYRPAATPPLARPEPARREGPAPPAAPVTSTYGPVPGEATLPW